MAPSDAAANAAAPKPMATKTAPTVMAATTTTANTVEEQWADMAPKQGDLKEPMHVEGASISLIVTIWKVTTSD